MPMPKAVKDRDKGMSYCPQSAAKGVSGHNIGKLSCVIKCKYSEASQQRGVVLPARCDQGPVRIMLFKNDTDVSRLKVCFIYTLLTYMPINMCKLMMIEMPKVRDKGKGNLLYPSTLTQLLQASYVSNDYGVDVELPPLEKAFDIMVVIEL
ncbi:hypothetical protein HAX54_022214 [Datura stramonium]|uniref:Uncharacterized protein n=1 Tax=Datura stramonium TaxID=4076 RepID=A0ABS8UWX5_DATST|nr:hypothetical protein [Datura stramonium]